MKTTEQIRAEQVSAAVDHLLREPDAQPEDLDPNEAGLLDTARQLAQLPSLLGPVDPVLEQRVIRSVQAGNRAVRRLPVLQPVWVASGLAAILLVVLLLTPLGETAVASFVAVFNLGRTEVRITPVDTPSALATTVAGEGAAVQQTLTLTEAQAQTHFPIPQPGYLPAGYRLRAVSSYSYPELPAWVPQPLFVELVYEDFLGEECRLRIYPIALGDQASISGMNLEASPIWEVRDVRVNRHPGVLLRLGSEGAEDAWQEVVWEQDDLILALSATGMTDADLLNIARSVQ
jgi:hypothetical protein